MSKSLRLLLKQFSRELNGRIVCVASAVDTDEGTRRQWEWLVSEGYAYRNTKSGRGIMGHRFSYQILEKGRQFIEDQNHKPDVCEECGEDVSKRGGGLNCPDGAFICRACFEAGLH